MAVLINTPLTIDEFSRLPQEGVRHEMNAGELITMPVPKYRHSRVATNLGFLLGAVVRESQTSEALLEAGYVLSRDPLTIRQPDVSVVSKERTRSVGEDEYIEGAPDLAVKVVSPSDSAQDLEIKIDQYLASGAKQVWVLYPKTKNVHVFSSNSTPVKFGERQTLTGGELIPGFSVLVADLFV
jgi:Uma2 family endonuclease